mmetsp:Transcript_29189/g.57233  ORF Transcript_29189/g.57233 Transcript_29189/m.57233 type:complete len:200 (-) Transcript_29189:361-960(-)
MVFDFAVCQSSEFWILCRHHCDLDIRRLEVNPQDRLKALHRCLDCLVAVVGCRLSDNLLESVGCLLFFCTTGTGLVPNKMPCRIHFEDLRARLVVDGDEHAHHRMQPHVRVLRVDLALVCDLVGQEVDRYRVPLLVRELRSDLPCTIHHCTTIRSKTQNRGTDLVGNFEKGRDACGVQKFVRHLPLRDHTNGVLPADSK